MTQFRFVPTLMSAALIVACGIQAAETDQTVTIQSPTKIPEATLAPGKYKFEVEDRLQDRAIVRITAATGGAHYLLLSVPDPRVRAEHAGLIRYHSTSNAQVARAWECPGCTTPLAFVYPKAEAAQITDDTAEPVLAVDPAYDKLPGSLTEDI